MLHRGDVDGHERHQQHAGRVHGEADELALVEVLGNLPCDPGIHRAHQDERWRCVSLNILCHYLVMVHTSCTPE